jgi:hypothetical protein
MFTATTVRMRPLRNAKDVTSRAVSIVLVGSHMRLKMLLNAATALMPAAAMDVPWAKDISRLSVVFALNSSELYD